jgi:hypothetical protein
MIKHRYTGAVLATGETVRQAAQAHRADLSGANLSGADLRYADLSGANLSGADLRDADLSGADLRYADLSGANLSGADLRDANLKDADLKDASLSGADLRAADLRRADLSGASLSGASLRDADLRGASLSGASLSGADLRDASMGGADLRDANLRYADLSGAKLPAFQIPQEGELIVWKAVRGGVCKLRVPPGAKRTASLIGRKCRAEWVEVLEAPKDGRGNHDSLTVYRAGETVRPDKYDDDPRVECTHGIHFFLTKAEAEEYR